MKSQLFVSIVLALTFISCGQNEPDNKRIVDDLNLRDIPVPKEVDTLPDLPTENENDSTRDEIPVPIESPPEEIDETKTETTEDTNVSVANIAKDYIKKFYDDDYRQDNLDMLALGEKRFQDHYQLDPIDYKGYVLGAPGEHILSGTDCTRFLWKIWNLALEKKSEIEQTSYKSIPYLVTMFLYDIVWSYEEVLKSEGKNISESNLKDRAFSMYQKRVQLKMNYFNKQFQEQGKAKLENYWKNQQISYFEFFDYVKEFKDAKSGDYILLILDKSTPLVERGHAYMFLSHSDEKQGVGAHNAKTGLAYNKHYKKDDRYVLRVKRVLY